MLLQDRLVLLIGGVSGVGKSTAAAEISRRLSAPWLMVDDLRLAIQRSRVMLPQGTDDLYFFSDVEDRQHVWQEPPERLRDALIATGEVMAPAIEAVVLNHYEQRLPVIIEGDGILPSLLRRPDIETRNHTNAIRAVFIVESSEDALLSNHLARQRGLVGRTEADLRTEARAKWLYGMWLRDEALRFQLPVIESKPWATLVDRILQIAAVRTH